MLTFMCKQKNLGTTNSSIGIFAFHSSDLTKLEKKA